MSFPSVIYWKWDDTQITIDRMDVVCLRKDKQQLEYWSPHAVCIKEERI